MPVISIEGTKLSEGQKRNLVKELTEISAKLMNVPEQAFVVLIKENDPENIGVGGVLLTDK
ncbi:4-oxalocrotonate tautomerase [Mobilisporobacter senegalensis]|uniref:4-oxalocrotonate tautomerase n=1 Tax=Mobilisporobacter senegalensis TaxID=1329262 RepID=A0A3N1XLB7_9FIRM|nr:4-oxalocrotonate tautomerase DmpI [Mobilisporobacter senegalensis]ROR25852.1 4-oxalocrotonate tautomerase [Mobilisporobacter senegalensis]